MIGTALEMKRMPAVTFRKSIPQSAQNCGVRIARDGGQSSVAVAVAIAGALAAAGRSTRVTGAAGVSRRVVPAGVAVAVVATGARAGVQPAPGFRRNEA